MAQPRRTEQAAQHDLDEHTLEVRDIEGVRGTVAAQSLQQADTQVLITFDQGRRVQAPAELLRRREDGTYLLPLSLRELSRGSVLLGPQASGQDEGSQILAVVPVIEEEAQVGKRTFETGRVRVTKSVQHTEEVVDVPLVRERVQVERIPMDQLLARPVAPFYEGNTLVIPVMEEVIVVEKRLLLREEVRVTTIREEHPHRETVSLRREEVQVNRGAAQPDLPDKPDLPHKENRALGGS